ncbi:MAG: NAD-dependent succinate-semialdehyde dehydrogenase [Gammaproteobacteria bacterium]
MPFVSINPATGVECARFDALDDAGVERALAQAALAAQKWAATPVADRLTLLGSAAALLDERRDALAELMTVEMGKRPDEARAEIEKCALACRFYVEHTTAWLADDGVVSDATRSYIARQPLGPVLAIMPWNFPFWQVFRFAAPALASGNVGLLKHASNVPQCSLAIERLFRDAGAPPGVFQALLVGSDRVERLIADARVRAITLTGSEGAGRAVAAQAGAHLKKCVLELGGSDPFIVLDDADLDAASATAVTARFQNAGQSCIAAKRFIVHDTVHDAFADRFAERIRSLDLAPVARRDLRDDLHDQVQRSLAAGARCVAGGKPVPGPGAFYEPTLLADVRPGMPAADEELFGPVAALIRVRDDNDALRTANGSRYGLGGSVWTRDIARGERMARELECGLAFVNGMVKSDPRLPFGGVKASGYGRELSREGLYEFLNVKSVWIG